MAEIKLPVMRDLTRIERIVAHSHIRVLGLDSSLVARSSTEGMVGQPAGRKAAGVILLIVQEGKIAGWAVLLAGQPGTGKQLLLWAWPNLLAKKLLLYHLSKCVVLSRDVENRSTKAGLSKAIGVRIKTTSEVIEGEVVEIQIDRPAVSGATSKRKD